MFSAEREAGDYGFFTECRPISMDFAKHGYSSQGAGGSCTHRFRHGGIGLPVPCYFSPFSAKSIVLRTKLNFLEQLRLTRTAVRIIVGTGDPDGVRGRERFPAIPVFRHSGASASQRFGVPAFRHSSVSPFLCFGIPAFPCSGMPRCRFHATPGHRSAVCAAVSAHERKRTAQTEEGRRKERICRTVTPPP